VGFPIGKIANVAGRVLGAILTSIPAVEAAGKIFQAGTGPQKRAAVLDVVQAELAAARLIVGADLADDAEVLEAADAINDTVVAFHKLLARKVAAAAGTS